MTEPPRSLRSLPPEGTRRPSGRPGGPAAAPTSILIAALGGEGGGLLCEWIVDAARRAGLPVQSTSVPGVAQRSGATSYYVEFLREPAPPGRTPVFALMPLPGAVDVVLASELLEAARMIERGFVTPERTLLIAARHRVYTTIEKMQRTDGRLDDATLHDTASALARRYLSLDLRALAEAHRTVISAVMFGALAGSGALPWAREHGEAAIRAGGVGVEASLAGFAAAFDAAQREVSPAGPLPMPATLREIVALGEAKLADYQDAGYAALYRQRVETLLDAAPAGPAHDEAARQLALWMAYEDASRVADLKTRASRFERVRAEAQAAPGDVLVIHEHLSPGLDEVAAILPRRLGAWLRGRVRHEHPIGARGAGRTLQTTSITGFVLLRLLAQARRWRRASLRFAEEQAAIESWLTALRHVLPRHAGFAAALAELPRLRKGYSDTWIRGEANYRRLFAEHVQPLVQTGASPDDAQAAALREALAAALDVAAAHAPVMPRTEPVSAPVRWVPRESSRTRREETTLTSPDPSER